MRTFLLEEDPELARWLSPAAVVEARRRTAVSVVRLRRGAWTPPENGVPPRSHLGFLCLDGVLARDELIAGSTSTELIGPGDLVQPWVEVGDQPLLPRTVTWSVLQPTRLAVLGPSFVAAVEPWPQLRSALLSRAMQRCARVSTQHALSQLSRVDARLIVLFWHLADRWGRTVPGGMLVPLPLSHAALGRLVGAKRPTVTLALRRLSSEALLSRRADGSWVLSGSAEDALAQVGRAELAAQPPSQIHAA